MLCCCSLPLPAPLATGTPSLPASVSCRHLPSHLLTHTHTGTQIHTHTKKSGAQQSQRISPSNSNRSKDMGMTTLV